MTAAAQTKRPHGPPTVRTIGGLAEQTNAPVPEAGRGQTLARANRASSARITEDRVGGRPVRGRSAEKTESAGSVRGPVGAQTGLVR